MLDIAPTELLLVAVVALLVIGPKDLPRAMRSVGKWVGRARGVARQFRSGFDAMVRESELAEMEKQWAAENERIMREHPPTKTLPAPQPYDSPDEDAPPIMVAQPEIRPEPEPVAEAAPAKPKRTRKPKAVEPVAPAPQPAPKPARKPRAKPAAAAQAAPAPKATPKRKPRSKAQS